MNNWERGGDTYFPNNLPRLLGNIAASSDANGALLAKHVDKYCFDMVTHFSSFGSVLNPGARIHYIVGNSTFYGNLVSTEGLYADALRKFGFVDVEVTAVRKRNSKKRIAGI